MRLKLAHSQQVLEGIVLEDFEMITKHASAMPVLLEDEKWMVFQTPEYRTHSNVFNEVCRDLKKAAERRNIDAATLAYMEMTMSCVNSKYTVAFAWRRWRNRLRGSLRPGSRQTTMPAGRSTFGFGFVSGSSQSPPPRYMWCQSCVENTLIRPISRKKRAFEALPLR